MSSTVKVAGYRIDRQIGKGGMAMVYLAIQESLDRPVALKVLNPLYSDTPEFSERFLKEGRIVASLQHSSIITIHDIGISDGVHYISMEYVEGGDLRGRIAEGISPDAALTLTERIGEALRTAHAVNVVHRDVKPSNILFRKDGTPLLTDFGIAKHLDDTSDLTLAGTMLGSPSYLSPEQARAKPVDGRSDIYSLGIILFEMLTGAKPFQGDSDLDTMRKHVEESAPQLSRPLQPFQPLLDRMIAKLPENRFQDASALLEFIHEHRQAMLSSSSEIVIPDNEGDPSDVDTVKNGAAGAYPADSTTVLNVAASDAFSEDETTQVNVGPADGPRTAAWLTRFKQRPPDNFIIGGITGFLAIIIVVASNWSSTQEVPPTVAMLASERVSEPAYVAISEPVSSNAESSRLTRALPATPRGENQGREDSTTWESDDGENERISRLLQAAGAALKEYRLTTPQGDNALDYYRAVLELDAENAEAKAGFVRIADAYSMLAQRAIDAGFLSIADTYIDRGLTVQPGDRRLLRLRNQAQAVTLSASRRGKVSGSNQTQGEIVGEPPTKLWKRVRSWFD